MKTVCKKLLSLMLVAILLISAVPMAFATEEDPTIEGPTPGTSAATTVNLTVKVYQDGKFVSDKSLTVDSASPVTLDKAAAEKLIRDWTGREYVNWTYADGQTSVTSISYDQAKALADSNAYLTIQLKSKTTTPNPDPSTPCENHTWGEWVKTKDPACIAKGEETRTCSVCKKTETRELPALGHKFGEYTVTKAATCTAKGEETRSCANCGQKETREIAALGHNIVNDECTRCHERGDHELTFIYLDTNNKEVKAYQIIKHGDVIKFPSAYNVEGKRIDYWYNEATTGYAEGAVKYWNTTGQKWENGRPLVYKAHYIVDTVQDNTAKLTIWANYYAGGVRQTLKLCDKSFTKSSYDNEMYKWLNDKDGGIATIQNEVKSHFGDDYQWADNNNYYDVNGKAIPSTMKDDGAKAIYINLTAKDATKAKVLVYVHLRDSKNNNKIIVTADRVIPMENYVKGDVVYAANVQKAVEGKYKFKEMSKLYTAKEFDRLIDGQNPTGANAVTVPEGGIEIHVVLNNATNKTTSNADKSNPKTGDNIDVVFTTMTISAMGLAAVAVLKKRKMI